MNKILSNIKKFTKQLIENMKETSLKTVKKIVNNIDDISIFSGLSVLIFTTFLVNVIAGLYTLGTVLFVFGVFIAKTSSKK